jgi:hypothetical protein
MTANKRPYRVVAVPFARTLDETANHLEDVQNALAEEGYVLALERNEQGFLVRGRQHKTQQEAPTAVEKEEEGEHRKSTYVPNFSPTAHEFIGHVLLDTDHSRSLDKTTAIEEAVQRASKKLAPHECEALAAEYEQEAREHTKARHERTPPCPPVEFFLAIAKSLRAINKFNLQ